MSARSKKQKQPPFISGFAVVAAGSVTMHALVYPTDVGDHDLALCNTIGAWGEKGWIEPNEYERSLALYCNPCLQRLKNMIADNDPRITRADRDTYDLAVLNIQRTSDYK